MNLGVADYDGLQTQISYRGSREVSRRRSATRCRRRPTPPSRTATASARTTRTSRASAKRSAARACVDQRHRAVITFSYQLPYNITAGTRDAARVGAAVQRDHRHRQQRRRREQRSAGGRRRGDRQVGVPRHRHAGRGAVRRGAHQGRRTRRSCCGWRASTCSTTATSSAARRRPTATPATVNPTFGQLVAVGTATNALPALANIDPPRMFQFQVRFLF